MTRAWFLPILSIRIQILPEHAHCLKYTNILVIITGQLVSSDAYNLTGKAVMSHPAMSRYYNIRTTFTISTINCNMSHKSIRLIMHHMSRINKHPNSMLYNYQHG